MALSRLFKIDHRPLTFFSSSKLLESPRGNVWCDVLRPETSSSDGVSSSSTSQTGVKHSHGCDMTFVFEKPVDNDELLE